MARKKRCQRECAQTVFFFLVAREFAEIGVSLFLSHTSAVLRREQTNLAPHHHHIFHLQNRWASWGRQDRGPHGVCPLHQALKIEEKEKKLKKRFFFFVCSHFVGASLNEKTYI
jgi:hypothetical protein